MDNYCDCGEKLILEEEGSNSWNKFINIYKYIVIIYRLYYNLIEVINYEILLNRRVCK